MYFMLSNDIIILLFQCYIYVLIFFYFSPVATVLVKHGTLKKGSIILVDETFAKVQ